MINNNNNMYEQLLPYQVKHCKQLYDSLLNNNCVIDASDTGTGKTFVSLFLCKKLNLNPFIICPKSVINNWIDVAKKLNVEIVGISNYEKLKGCRYYTSNLEDVICPYVDKIIEKEYEIKQKKTKKNKKIEKNEENEKIEKNEENKKFYSKNDNKNFLMKFDKTNDNQEKTSIIPKLESESESETNSGTESESEYKIKNKKKKIDYNFVFQFPHNTILIFDEAHKCKNYKSITSKMLLSAQDSGKKILLLSATICDKIICFKPFGVVFGFYPNINKFKLWLRRQFTMRKIEFSNSKYKNYSEEQLTLKIIHDVIFPKLGSRLKIKELGDAFPQNKIIAQCYYTDDHEQVDKLYQIINEAIADLSKKELKSDALGKIIRARMKIEMLKVPILIDLIEDSVEQNLSVVVFVNFKDTLLYLCHHLKCDCVIHGDQTKEERQLCIDDFQNNKYNIIICMIQAGGVGISLHDLNGKQRTSIISPSWNGTDVVQALGRIHRAGSKSPCIQKIVYIAKSYEEEICKNLTEKMATLQGINDGDLVPIIIPTDKLKELNELENINTNKNINDKIDNKNIDFKKDDSLLKPKKKIYKKIVNDLK
jgi:superfamily II DNA/RNA helicase